MLIVLLSSTMSFWGQTANGADKSCVPPRVLGNPHGPQGDYSLKEGATALVSIEIDKKGHASDPTLVQSSGDKKYDHDAMNIVREWQYAPSVCKGKPVEVRLEVTVQYTPARQPSH